MPDILQKAPFDTDRAIKAQDKTFRMLASMSEELNALKDRVILLEKILAIKLQETSNETKQTNPQGTIPQS